MPPKQKLLVLLDGSPRSRRALEYIASIKSFQKNDIVLYQVYSDAPQFCGDLGLAPHPLTTLETVVAWRDKEKKRLDDFMARTKDILVAAGFQDSNITIRLNRLQIGIARDILSETDKGYGAIVLKRRGMGTVTNVAVGSVAAKVLAGVTETPVILAGKKTNNKKLLIAVDGSRSSRAAVEFACRLIAKEDYAVYLLHVIRAHNLNVMPSEMLAGHKKRMLQTFGELKETLTAAGIAPENITDKIITGVPSRANTIVKEAKTNNINTVVLGRRGLSHGHDLQMGQVYRKVMQSGRDLSLWIV